jgi:hypothetical protein
VKERRRFGEVLRQVYSIGEGAAPVSADYAYKHIVLDLSDLPLRRFHQVA